jgi:hypothetical protein
MVIGDPYLAITLTTAGCTARESNIPVYAQADGSLTFPLNFASIACVPNPCMLSWTVTNGSASQPVTIDCPGSFPAGEVGTARLVDDQTLTVSSEMGCELTYLRDIGAMQADGGSDTGP